MITKELRVEGLRNTMGYSVPQAIIVWTASKHYLLTPYSTVLLKKLTGLQLVKKFPAFYGTRRFIAAITGARHLSLS
jgi:hypothetical protein